MNKMLKWVGIALVVLVVLSVAFGGKGGDAGSKAQNAFKAGMEAGQQQAKYQELARKDAGAVENISVLVGPGGSDTQPIAQEVKRTCNKQCNINLYDDKKAFELQEQYDAMMADSNTKPADLEAWKKANYVYVADHLVGYVEFSSGSFDDFPFKDSYYRELTSNKN